MPKLNAPVSSATVRFATVAPIRTMRVNTTNSACVETRTEIDSHADICVARDNMLLFQDFDRPVKVTGYDKSTGTKKNCRTVSAAVAYNSPNGGEVIIMAMHQAIYIPGMDHNLVCPM